MISARAKSFIDAINAEEAHRRQIARGRRWDVWGMHFWAVWSIGFGVRAAMNGNLWAALIHVGLLLFIWRQFRGAPEREADRLRMLQASEERQRDLQEGLVYLRDWEDTAEVLRHMGEQGASLKAIGDDEGAAVIGYRMLKMLRDHETKWGITVGDDTEQMLDSFRKHWRARGVDLEVAFEENVQ